MNEKNPVAIDVTHTTLSVLFIGLLAVSNFWILRPFLVSLIWAALIVTATWPVLIKLQNRLAGKRGLAAAIMTLAILLVILIPVAFSILAIANHVQDIGVELRSLDSLIPSSPPKWLEHIPLAGEKLAARWKDLAVLTPEERSSLIEPYVEKVFLWFIAQAGNIGMIMLQFFLTTIIAAILYTKGEIIRTGILRFARRLAGSHGEDIVVLAGKAIRGVAVGVVLTALIQAGMGSIGLIVTGVPGAAFLTAVMIMLCLAQIGPAIVLIPAVIWLFWKGDAFWGTILVIFAVPTLIIDNLLRPILIRKGADLPLLLIFTGVIGGLIAFGIIGLFIGPMVLVVTYTLLKAWVTSDEGGAEGAKTE